MLSMSKEQRLAFDKVTTVDEASVILYTCAVDKSISELGRSVYDSVSCEQLADQYMTRCGAGKDGVVGLDKFFSLDSEWRRTKDNTFLNIVLLVVGLVTIFPTYTLLVMALNKTKENDSYDNLHARFSRIKDQLIQRLKTKDLPNKEIEVLLSDIETLDGIIKKSGTKLTLIEKVAYLLNPSYRNAHKYELLQKELETLSNNNLFIQAAKLSTL